MLKERHWKYILWFALCTSKNLVAPNLLLLCHLSYNQLFIYKITYSLECSIAHIIFFPTCLYDYIINIYYSVLSNSKICVTIFAKSSWYQLYFGFGNKKTEEIHSNFSGYCILFLQLMCNKVSQKWAHRANEESI